MESLFSFGDRIGQKTVLLKINSSGEVLKSKVQDPFLLLVCSPLTGVYIKAEPAAPDGIKLSVISENDLFN